MGVITSLTVQKRNPNRLNVYLDGVFAFGLATAVATNLKIGQTLSANQITSLQQQDDVSKAKEKAVQLISRRPRSIAEIERYLRSKEYEVTVIEQAVTRLQGVGLLDDEAFARYWVDQRDTFKPRSHLALRQELQQKGIARDIIETAIKDVDQLAAAQRAATKQANRYAHLSQEEFRKKLGGFLQRRGFYYGIIQQVTNELWETISKEQETDYESGDW